ncbi:hypothetical protein [Croceivirga thetidis]|uniref:Uncharacterized protein n=1 Tax=Croceivirga thetidis TaxID=2721623 RepID=A0ABX1GM23_9FLAO|nr:hypothetical protein [Croceivirga thetidis]NKI30943.1 hypothetical protein [Croceivirga thetidis]
MIKFFRRIRQKLLSENRFSKYLVYAIGEIILVMVGILLALQVNTWNANREDREREALLIQQLHLEMQDNLEQFKTVQENISRLVNSGKEIVSVFPLNAKNVQEEPFQSNFLDFLYCPSFDPYQGTIKSIISSGNLNLIQNDQLRKLIVTWEDVVRDYKEEEQIAWEYGYEIMDWSTENFPNPNFVEPEWENANFRGLQSKMGEKINRYEYCIVGEDVKNLEKHIQNIIALTTPSKQ